jgi:hypothetical protein
MCSLRLVSVNSKADFACSLYLFTCITCLPIVFTITFLALSVNIPAGWKYSHILMHFVLRCLLKGVLYSSSLHNCFRIKHVSRHEYCTYLWNVWILTQLTGMCSWKCSPIYKQTLVTGKSCYFSTAQCLPCVEYVQDIQYIMLRHTNVSGYD